MAGSSPSPSGGAGEEPRSPLELMRAMRQRTSLGRRSPSPAASPPGSPSAAKAAKAGATSRDAPSSPSSSGTLLIRKNKLLDGLGKRLEALEGELRRAQKASREKDQALRLLELVKVTLVKRLGLLEAVCRERGFDVGRTEARAKLVDLRGTLRNVGMEAFFEVLEEAFRSLGAAAGPAVRPGRGSGGPAVALMEELGLLGAVQIMAEATEGYKKTKVAGEYATEVLGSTVAWLDRADTRLASLEGRVEAGHAALGSRFEAIVGDTRRLAEAELQGRVDDYEGKVAELKKFIVALESRMEDLALENATLRAQAQASEISQLASAAETTALKHHLDCIQPPLSPGEARTLGAELDAIGNIGADIQLASAPSILQDPAMGADAYRNALALLTYEKERLTLQNGLLETQCASLKGLLKEAKAESTALGLNLEAVKGELVAEKESMAEILVGAENSRQGVIDGISARCTELETSAIQLEGEQIGTATALRALRGQIPDVDLKGMVRAGQGEVEELAASLAQLEVAFKAATAKAEARHVKEVEGLAGERDGLQADLAAARAEAAEAQAEARALVEEGRAQAQKHAETRVKLAAARDEAQRREARVEEMAGTIGKIEREKEALLDRNDLTMAKYQNVRDELTRVLGEATSKTGEIGDLQDELERAGSVQARALEEKEHLWRKTSQLEAKLLAAEQAAAEARQAADQRQAMCVQFEVEIMDLTTSLSGAEKKLAKAEMALEEAGGSGAELEATKEQLAAVEEDKAFFEGLADSRLAEVKGGEAKAEELERRVAELARGLEETEQRHEEELRNWGEVEEDLDLLRKDMGEKDALIMQLQQDKSVGERRTTYFKQLVDANMEMLTEFIDYVGEIEEVNFQVLQKYQAKLGDLDRGGQELEATLAGMFQGLADKMDGHERTTKDIWRSVVARVQPKKRAPSPTKTRKESNPLQRRLSGELSFSDEAKGNLVAVSRALAESNYEKTFAQIKAILESHEGSDNSAISTRDRWKLLTSLANISTQFNQAQAALTEANRESRSGSFQVASSASSPRVKGRVRSPSAYV